MAERPRSMPWRAAGAAALVAAGLIATPLLVEARLARRERELDGAWERVPVAPRGATRLGLSFRPLQAEVFGLQAQPTLDRLLRLTFDVVRLPAYWDRIESGPGRFDTSELDRQLAAAESAGKQVVLGVGAVKNFGYPEFFVPGHHLESPLAEGRRVTAAEHRPLLDAACGFVRRVVERYRTHSSVVAWQLEHEAVDPLGVEHSWRLSADFVAAELAAVRETDPNRPVMMNGFLPTSSLVRINQGWRTRDQGDSLAVATRLADIVGIDYYPRHALASFGSRTLYLAGARLAWQRALVHRQLEAIASSGKRLLVAEGQAEPWEAVTEPPNPKGRTMYSCGPAETILNYNTAMGWTAKGVPLEAYLFWGAEYWVLRERSGDSSYMRAFERVAAES